MATCKIRPMGPIVTRKLSDLKTHLLDLRELAERGTIVYLTYHGRPRCALVPLEAARRLEASDILTRDHN